MFTEQKLRDCHRQSMKAIGEWADTDYDRDHETDVVAVALAFQRGERERPYVHSHGPSERGYCTECDAAFLLMSLEDEIHGRRDA